MQRRCAARYCCWVRRLAVDTMSYTEALPSTQVPLATPFKRPFVSELTTSAGFNSWKNKEKSERLVICFGRLPGLYEAGPRYHAAKRKRAKDRRAVARERHGLFRCSAFAAARVRRPSIQNIRERYSARVPPGPNTCTLNIKPLGQFRPHRSFL